MSFKVITLTAEEFTEMNCVRAMTPSGTSGVFGIHTVVDDITFDSKIEAACYKELKDILGASRITHKKWYPGNAFCSDFYIAAIDMWIEVSSFNDEKYLSKIYTKRKLVENFAFFNDPAQIKPHFGYTEEGTNI